MRIRYTPRARGMALPVVLIVLAVMLLGSIYLMKSVRSTALTTANLTYDTTLSRAADLGLHTGFAWLSQAAAGDKKKLEQDDPGHGYVARWDGTQPRSDSFWTGKQTMPGDDNTTIEYVIHRMCADVGPYNDSRCVTTSANTATLGNAVALGASLASDAPTYAGVPRLHYVIAARITGGRGASVTNQMIVMIGA
jgi:hypothetical protein